MRLLKWLRHDDYDDHERERQAARKTADEGIAEARASRLKREEILQHELDIIVARRNILKLEKDIAHERAKGEDV